MDPSADREARSPTELQRCHDPDLFDEEIGSVTADGAYDNRKCHEAIAARGAVAVRQGKGPPDPFRAFLTLDVSRFCTAPSARLGHFSFEDDRTFPA